jgi:hypothetical protein
MERPWQQEQLKPDDVLLLHWRREQVTYADIR